MSKKLNGWAVVVVTLSVSITLGAEAAWAGFFSSSSGTKRSVRVDTADTSEDAESSASEPPANKPVTVEDLEHQKNAMGDKVEQEQKLLKGQIKSLESRRAEVAELEKKAKENPGDKALRAKLTKAEDELSNVVEGIERTRNQKAKDQDRYADLVRQIGAIQKGVENTSPEEKNCRGGCKSVGH